MSRLRISYSWEKGISNGADKTKTQKAHLRWRTGLVAKVQRAGNGYHIATALRVPHLFCCMPRAFVPLFARFGVALSFLERASVTPCARTEENRRHT